MLPCRSEAAFNAACREEVEASMQWQGYREAKVAKSSISCCLALVCPVPLLAPRMQWLLSAWHFHGSHAPMLVPLQCYHACQQDAECDCGDALADNAARMPEDWAQEASLLKNCSTAIETCCPDVAPGQARLFMCLE